MSIVSENVMLILTHLPHMSLGAGSVLDIDRFTYRFATTSGPGFINSRYVSGLFILGFEAPMENMVA